MVDLLLLKNFEIIISIHLHKAESVKVLAIIILVIYNKVLLIHRIILRSAGILNVTFVFCFN